MVDFRCDTKQMQISNDFMMLLLLNKICLIKVLNSSKIPDTLMQNPVIKEPNESEKSQNNPDQPKVREEASANYEFFIPEARKLIKQVFYLAFFLAIVFIPCCNRVDIRRPFD